MGGQITRNNKFGDGRFLVGEEIDCVGVRPSIRLSIEVSGFGLFGFAPLYTTKHHRIPPPSLSHSAPSLYSYAFRE